MDCKSCRWFDASPDYFGEEDMSQELVGEKDEYGFCRRHAPGPTQSGLAVELEFWWPLVGDWQWCGEWQQREEATDGTHPQS